MILYNFNLQGAPFDTGMITLTQPNDITFTGRIWGDEFIYWMETEGGYRFIETFDGWFYYATLDQTGEYIATSYKVGIDSPPVSSYKLERSQARLNEIEEEKEQFNEQIELNRQWFTQKQAEADANQEPVTLEVGIVLIEFQDVKHFENETNRPDGYLTADFDSMMFSYNYWYDVTSPTPHPENELIFGSFRDYWDQISLGKLKIEGRVANPTDENGVPIWITAKDSIEFYATTLSEDWDTLADEAITEALENEWIDTSDENNENYFDNIVVIYAGKAQMMGSLRVKGGKGLGSNWIFLAERSTRKLYYGNIPSFTHIGIYAHEFGHDLGFDEEYYMYTPEIDVGEDGATNIFNFCLMAEGLYTGPLEKGECPATLSPYYRIRSNWVFPDTLTENVDNFIVEYDYLYPKFYCIVPVDATEGEHYIFETRKREGFDLYIPSDPTDTVDQAGRLLIWQHDTHSDSPMQYYTDRIRVVPADNDRNDDIQNQLNDFFPADLYNNYQSFNNTTSPSATINETHPYFNQPGDPAYFVLNGIQKLANGNTLIGEISPNQITLLNEIAANWQTVSVGAIVSDYSASSVFPTATPPVYEYVPGQGYAVRNTLSNGPGYWVKFDSTQTLIQKGKLLDSINVSVVKGWNLIGSISFTVPYLNICTEPPGLINTIYYYNGGYHYIEQDDTLKPSVGYWFKSNNSGSVILLRNFNCPENEGLSLSDMDKFIVTDSDGKSQELYVANMDIDTMVSQIDRGLPPPVPDIDFDVRFNYGEFIKAVSMDSGEVDLEIDVQTNSYPITLSWEINPANGIEYSFLSDSGLGKISSLDNKNRSLAIGENSKGKIKLFGKIGNTLSTKLPEKFELYQNYPNPFNPSTQIKYAVKENGMVTLKVYDVLGKEVASLVNEEKQAGTYTVTFDAGKMASGIYFYTITANNFQKTKKMLLIK